MKRTKWIALIVLALLVVFLGSALALADFKIIKGQMEKHSAVASSHNGGQDAPQITPDKTGLFVSGDDKLARALQQELARRLSGQLRFGEIVIVDGSSDSAGYPLLFVVFNSQDINWTPVYATSQMEAAVFYASDGDVSFRHSQPPTFKFTSDQPAFKSSGKYTFNDVSWGLISNPGYTSYLAGEIAAAIAADFQVK